MVAVWPDALPDATMSPVDDTGTQTQMCWVKVHHTNHRTPTAP